MIRAHTLQKSTMFNFAKCLEAKRKDVDVEYRWELQLVVHSPGLGKAASSLHRKTEEQWLIRAHTVIISLSVWRRGRGILTWDIAGGCSWRIVLVSSPLPSPPLLLLLDMFIIRVPTFQLLKKTIGSSMLCFGPSFDMITLSDADENRFYRELHPFITRCCCTYTSILHICLYPVILKKQSSGFLYFSC